LISLGLDGWHYLTTANRADQIVLDHLAERVIEHRETEQHNAAVAIWNVYAQAQKKGR
jgi:hypothetical protein